MGCLSSIMTGVFLILFSTTVDEVSRTVIPNGLGVNKMKEVK